MDRPFTSWRDEELDNSNFIYSENYFTSREFSNLSIVGTGTNLTSPQNLGDLSPAAGGNPEDLGNLSPAAGGIAGETTVYCANAYLDTEFDVPAEQRDCIPQAGEEFLQ